MIVLNDLHLGVRRSAGTTQQTAYDLRQWLQGEYEEMLRLDDEVVINGDFFDTHSVPLEDVLQAYIATAYWLKESKDRKITCVAGNHDLSKDSRVVGSFQVFASLLETNFPGRARYLEGADWVDEKRGVYAISHVLNQDLFDALISDVPETAKILFLHCNFDSPFAEHSDHSLNLSRAQAKKLVDQGTQIVIAHEHHGRDSFGGKVLITGNQIPSSVSDCVTPNGKTQSKRALRINADGTTDFIETWRPGDDTGFLQLDWTTLNEQEGFERAAGHKGFIRIDGRATPEESAEALRLVSRLRQNSQAFVVANAIKVDQRQDLEGLATSVEDVRGVDIVEMLIETLSEEQQAVVRRVMKGK